MREVAKPVFNRVSGAMSELFSAILLAYTLVLVWQHLNKGESVYIQVSPLCWLTFAQNRRPTQLSLQKILAYFMMVKKRKN